MTEIERSVVGWGRPTIWVTPNKNSQVVCAAVHRATGFPMKQIYDAGAMPGPSIVYGLLRGCSELIQRCEASGVPYWHIDHGYFRRSAPEKFDGYYRITKNGLALEGNPPEDVSRVRWDALGLLFPEQREDNGPHFVCPPTAAIAAHYRVKPMEWAMYWCQEIKKASREAIIRLKGSTESSAEAIARAGKIVAFNSNLAVEARLQGVESWQEHGPVKPWSSESTFHWLANNQWKLDEIAPGIFQ